MYELEQKIKQLEKCECRRACKWRPQRPHSRAERAQAPIEEAAHNEEPETRFDGERWRSKCDVCSCHVSTLVCLRPPLDEPTWRRKSRVAQLARRSEGLSEADSPRQLGSRGRPTSGSALLHP